LAAQRCDARKDRAAVLGLPRSDADKRKTALAAETQSLRSRLRRSAHHQISRARHLFAPARRSRQRSLALPRRNAAAHER